MRLLIDIDDHIFYSYEEKCIECGSSKYEIKGVDQKEIDLINKAYDLGHEIVFYTARGWAVYDLTYNQLKEYGVKFHQLIMGKLTGVYIDKDSLQSVGQL